MQINPNFIAGEWVTSSDYSININPSNLDDVVGHYAKASETNVADAIAAAKTAQNTWGRTAPFQRAAALNSIANELRAQTPRLAKILAREEGKTLREATGEVGRAVATFEYFAFILQTEQGAMFASQRPNMSIHTRHRPVGVVAVITPWNFPIAVPAWKIAPALAYGNSVLFKPAEVVSATAWALTEIIAKAGLPAGAFNLVMGSGRVIGNIVAGHPDVNAITFTGSTQVGSELLKNTHARSNARVQTEMGGKNGILVLDDADIDIAVDSIADSAFGSTGQRCTATSRIIVTPGVYQELADRLTERVLSLRVGDALDESTQMGPVAHDSQLSTDLSYIEIGQNEGAELIAGGAVIDKDNPGHFLAPTLFAGGTTEMRINQEEIFGPVACLIEARDLEHGLELLNDTPYGLSAGIITRSLQSSEYFQERAEAGLISVNASPAVSEHHVPFGGIKDSGHGPREQGSAAKEFFTQQSTHFVRSY
ncbi:MAG TPA: aldehyde dehydrogenase family protein [Microbacteriaceae bacterium]|nr:aldehyde dehydrogenase family protein [Microbacteriaceae bacterium]